MSIRIVDCKKLDMTDDEYAIFEKIVKSYTTMPTMNGRDLFIDLFESDDKGIIMFLKPPSKRQTTFEVFLFLISLQQHQHLRLMHEEVADIASQMKAKILEIDEKLSKLA